MILFLSFVNSSNVVAKCLNSFSRRFFDLIGGEHYASCRCGRCINCLHAEQDSWSIRLLESLKASKSFVYDTLTFSNRNLPCIDFRAQYWEGDFSDDSKRLIDKYYSRCDLNTGELSVWLPFVTRQVVRDWLKRGRELYAYSHSGSRLPLKYFIVMEYGPKSSRPHFHCLFFNISREDYILYFGNAWRKLFGFTKTKYFSAKSGKELKDIECISRYVSKYVSKGVFESPFVKDGLLPKPFRSISHGIGVEYLDSPFFDWFRSPVASVLKDICVNTDYLSGDIERCRHLRYLINSGFLDDIKLPSEAVLNRLVTYYDTLGKAHALPRYYRAKLCNSFKPNLLHYVVQINLLELARVQFNKGLQRLAVSLGYGAKVVEGKVKSAFAGFSRRLYNFLGEQDCLAKAVQARLDAQRRYTRLKNHYGRAMNLSSPLMC